MVKLEEHKHQTESKPIEKMCLPAEVFIPLSQHLGKICNPLVKIGDEVFTGQKLASAVDAAVSSPIHASISGKVIAIQDWPHPLLGQCKAIVIEGDGLDRTQNTEHRTQSEIDKLTPDEIRNLVFEAGIVGLGGAGFPTHIKLKPPKTVETLIINGAECEPYLTGDYRLMIEKTEEIIKGIELIVKCTGANLVYIAIEDNKPEAIKAFTVYAELCRNHRYPETSGSASRRDTSNNHYIRDRLPFTVKVLKSYYPQGGEKQLIKSILGKEVPSGKLPFDIGVVAHNVATVFAIYEAVFLRKPLYERVVTVTGDCLKNPKNLLVRIGSPIKDLIAQCGPLEKEPQKIVFGGPMMGIAQYSLDTPVVKTTNGVILLSKGEIKEIDEAFCIRCGRCVEYCPLGLMPCLMRLASGKEKWDLAAAYGCLECMECGLCNYVCPQKINILQAIKQAKSNIHRQ